MSVNSSSSSNAFLPPSLSSSINISPSVHSCVNSTTAVFIITASSITDILVVLPLCILILYLGLQRWRQQRSGTSMSHFDFFTYNMVVIELINIFGSTLACFGIYTDLPQIMMVGIYLLFINSTGQTFFHILTCVERYLAVVHPITYLSLRKAKAIKTRNIAVGCVWLLCFVGTAQIQIGDDLSSDILSYLALAFALTVISFCSLSVLCVLTRPGPGEGGGDRQRLDQSKLRAFYTIMAILGVLVFRFAGHILSMALYGSPQLGESERCAMLMSIAWFGFPSSLVLPLLFLQRAGKLLCCENINKSGQGSD